MSNNTRTSAYQYDYDYIPHYIPVDLVVLYTGSSCLTTTIPSRLINFADFDDIPGNKVLSFSICPLGGPGKGVVVAFPQMMGGITCLAATRKCQQGQITSMLYIQLLVDHYIYIILWNTDCHKPRPLNLLANRNISKLYHPKITSFFIMSKSM
jgi:hypothetical protein